MRWPWRPGLLWGPRLRPRRLSRSSSGGPRPLRSLARRPRPQGGAARAAGHRLPQPPGVDRHDEPQRQARLLTSSARSPSSSGTSCGSVRGGGLGLGQGAWTAGRPSAVDGRAEGEAGFAPDAGSRAVDRGGVRGRRGLLGYALPGCAALRRVLPAGCAAFRSIAQRFAALRSVLPAGFAAFRSVAQHCAASYRVPVAQERL